MEAPRRQAPSLVGTGGRRRAQPRDVGEYPTSGSAPDRYSAQGAAQTLPNESSNNARGLVLETTGTTLINIC